MSEAVFALEITSSAVCVALGTQAMRGAKIERLIVRDLPVAAPVEGFGDPDVELQARAKPVVSALIAELGLRGHAGAFVVPDHDVFTRLLAFPFAALRRAEMIAAVGGELEGLLPLELDELVFAFDVLPKPTPASPAEGGPSASGGPEVGARVLAQAMPRKDAEGWIAFAQACGFVAASLLSPLGALAEVAAGRGKGDQALLMLDLDADRTDLVIAAGNKLVFARSLGRGTAEMLRNELSRDERQPLASFDESGLALWLRDVQQSLAACEERLGVRPQAAVVLGRGAAAVGQVVGVHLNLRVLGLAELMDTTNVPANAGEHITVVGAALSRGRDKPVFDLRQGSLALAGDRSFWRAKTSVFIACAAAILLFAAGAGWAAYYRQSHTFATLSGRLRTESTQLFGAAKSAKEVLAEAGGALSTVQSPVPKMTAYDIFVEINDKLPGKDKVTLDVTSLEITLDKVSLRGNAKTSEEIDLVDSALKQITCFSDPSRGQTQTAADGAKTFQLSYKQACM